jgi:hypothetical protein
MAGTVLWHDSSNPLAALQAFQYEHQAEMVEHEVSLWRFFCRIHKGGTLDLLKRRGSSAPARSKLCFGNPVMDCLTGAYEDVDETLAVIKKYVLQTLGMRLAVVWGDQQSYSRMVHLAIAGGVEYAWMIPAPGEFHFTVHALMALHKKESGWWSALIEWVCLPYDEEAKPPQLGGGFCCSIAEKWDSVEKYNQYCAFYEGLICAVMEYVQEMVPAWLLHVPTVLVTLLTDLGAQGAPCL